MSDFVLKASPSGTLGAATSEIARRNPGVAARVASLPLISILGMIWLWRDTGDTARIATHAEPTVWHVLPSLPILILMPWLLRSGTAFWPSLAIGCVLAVALYLLLALLASRFNLPL